MKCAGRVTDRAHQRARGILIFLINFSGTRE